MKPLYTKSEYKNAKSNDKLSCECYQCKQPFLTMKKLITHQLKMKSTQNKIRYCSHVCHTLSSITKITLNCTNCNIEFKKTKNQHEKTKNHFCSQSCSATYSNLNKKTGNKRSKLEKWLEEKLINKYPNLPIEFNKKTTIKSELDIFIPSLSIAFELNGIYHYKPIHGQEKLDKIKLNDIKKQNKCNENNIKLFTIDTSSQKKFNDDTSQIYLNMIIDAIDKKLY